LLGFSVALGSVFATNGLFHLFDGMVDRFFMLKSNSLMIVSRGSTLIQIVPFNSRVSESLIADIEDIPGVQAVIKLHFKDFSNSSPTSFSREVIVGIELPVLKNFFLQSVPLAEGRWPNANSNEVIIGPEISEGKIDLGDQISIRNESFSVVGITEADNPMFDHFIYVDYDKISTLYDVQGYCNMMYVAVDALYTDDPESMRVLKNQIAELDNRIEVMDADAIRAAAGDFFTILDIFQLVFGMFPLIISVIFIFVLLMLNLKDQRREFAILQAIGIPPWKIGVTVFIPTFLIAFCGYFLSIGVGFLLFGYSYFNFMDFAVDFTGPLDFAEYMNRKIPNIVYQNTLIGTIIIGFAIAVLPAFASTKGHIIEHLRREE
jgi:ABC-type antimicrobial peptide transport system permease subunit